MTVGESQTKAPERSGRSWIDSWLPYKPNIDPAVQDELNHYSTDHLSRLYHEQTMGYIQLRNLIISPKELDEEVQRRRIGGRRRRRLSRPLGARAIRSGGLPPAGNPMAFEALVIHVGPWMESRNAKYHVQGDHRGARSLVARSFRLGDG
jgi:hypothetical protein